MKDLVVVGAGGFGREVLDVVDAVNAVSGSYRVRGVVDDHPAPENLERLARRNVSYVGGVADVIRLDPAPHYIIGIGLPAVRRRIAEQLDAAGATAATLVHPTATMGFDVKVGAGSVICAGVRLTTNITLGRHVHLNLNCTVGHDASLGDFVSVNPLGSISGDCRIEEDVLIGVAAVVLNERTVGRGAVVGGVACVTKDIAPGAVVKGIPAR